MMWVPVPIQVKLINKEWSEQMARNLHRKMRRLATGADEALDNSKRKKSEIIRHARELTREQWRKLKRDARTHLLRVAAVHRYGNPKMGEPLELAYKRALSKVKADFLAKRDALTIEELEKIYPP